MSTPLSIMSSNSRNYTPTVASNQGNDHIKIKKKHYGFFDPNSQHRSADKLIDPGVTVYASALDPETKLRSNTLKPKDVIIPRIRMSPKKSEKVSEHYLEKNYNWRLKKELDLKNNPVEPVIKSPLRRPSKKNPPIITDGAKDS